MKATGAPRDFSIDSILSESPRNPQKRSSNPPVLPPGLQSPHVDPEDTTSDHEAKPIHRNQLSTLRFDTEFKDESKDDSKDQSQVLRSEMKGREVVGVLGDGRKVEDAQKLSWLQYTRYRPPKIPRKTGGSRDCKRKPSLHPRIPFSASQLRFLEERYRRNAYLSRNDVTEISAALKLPNSRVKIWFQNRRARERREGHEKTA